MGEKPNIVAVVVDLDTLPHIHLTASKHSTLCDKIWANFGKL